MKEGLKEMKNERMQVKSSSGRDMKKIKKCVYLVYALDSEAPASEDKDSFAIYIKRETTINSRDLPTIDRVLAEDETLGIRLNAKRGT